MDSKIINSYAKGINKETKKDGRRDTEAKYFIKKYHYKDEKTGEEKTKKKTYFGYKMHLMVDSNYELPVQLPKQRY